MTRSGAQLLTRATLMRLLPGWSFEFDSAKRFAGRCWYGKKLITLSVHHVDCSTVEQVQDTILHEVAHAIAGPTAGHGPVWQAVAVGLGCSGQARCSEGELPDGKYTAECGCGLPHRKFHRRPKRQYVCRGCKENLQYDL